jgi:hypothetical protein
MTTNRKVNLGRPPGGDRPAGRERLLDFSNLARNLRAKTAPGLILVQPPRSDNNDTASGAVCLGWHCVLAAVPA